MDSSYCLKCKKNRLKILIQKDFLQKIKNI